jgi:hypothetical protein
MIVGVDHNGGNACQRCLLNYMPQEHLLPDLAPAMMTAAAEQPSGVLPPAVWALHA